MPSYIASPQLGTVEFLATRMRHCQLWASTKTGHHGSMVHDYIEELFLCIPPQQDSIGFTSTRKAPWVISNATILE